MIDRAALVLEERTGDAETQVRPGPRSTASAAILPVRPSSEGRSPAASTRRRASSKRPFTSDRLGSGSSLDERRDLPCLRVGQRDELPAARPAPLRAGDGLSGRHGELGPVGDEGVRGRPEGRQEALHGHLSRRDVHLDPDDAPGENQLHGQLAGFHDRSLTKRN